MSKKISIIGLSIILLIAACAQNRSLQFKGKTQSERLAQFFDWSFKIQLDRSPEGYASIGIKKKEGQLDDLSLSYAEETLDIVKDHLDILRSFDRSQLSLQEKTSYDVYEQQAQTFVEGWKWRDYDYSVNQMFGVQAHLPSFMIGIHKVENVQDAKNYILRLQKFRNTLSDVINNMMRSETKGSVLPQFVFEKVISDSRNIILGRPFDNSKKDSPLFKDFKAKVKKLKISKRKKSDLIKQAAVVLKSSVEVGYKNLITFLTAQEKRGTTDDGAWKFPKGNDYYRYRIKKETTTDLTPDQIHQMGLVNVQRIHREMVEIKNKLKFKGDLQVFFKYMKSNKFYNKNTKSGKRAYMKMAKKYISDMEKNLSKYFITLPKAKVQVKPVEAFREKSTGLAFYQNPTMDGRRPGTYYVNLYNMKTLPRWEAEALAYHEGIPGHHMQVAISMELQKVPMFRRVSHFNAYDEGWGLYSERLPKEVGFYKDPHSDFGRLSMELVRACRLVVDTGIHWKKWTRGQAIAYLDKNTPGDHTDNVRQINRYTVWPGQATGYMVGMLKIVELREKAKARMGKGFNLRKFHDVVLTSGSVPMGTLETIVDEYIKAG